MRLTTRKTRKQEAESNTIPWCDSSVTTAVVSHEAPRVRVRVRVRVRGRGCGGGVGGSKIAGLVGALHGPGEDQEIIRKVSEVR